MTIENIKKKPIKVEFRNSKESMNSSMTSQPRTDVDQPVAETEMMSNNWNDASETSALADLKTSSTLGISESAAEADTMYNDSSEISAPAQNLPGDEHLKEDDSQAGFILERCKEAFTRFNVSFIEWSYCLHTIKTNKWYQLASYGNYESFETFVEETFKLKRSHLFNYLKVWAKYGEIVTNNDTPQPKLKTAYANYSLTQLIELSRLDEKAAATVTPQFTVEQIRKLKKKKVNNSASFSHTETKKNLTAKSIRAYLKTVLAKDANASFTIIAAWN